MLAVDSSTGEVLAQFATLDVPFRIQGNRFLGGQSVDDFCKRRTHLTLKKLYARIRCSFHRHLATSSDTVDFLYGFPGIRHLRLLLHENPLRQTELVPYFQRTPMRPRFLSLTRWKIVPMESESELTALESRSAMRYPSAALRDGDRLRYRYLAHPERPYISIGALRGDTLSAWAVFRQRDQELILGDLLWDGVDPGALHAIDRWAVRHARKRGLSSLSMWLHGDPAATDAFLQWGWERKDNPLALGTITLPYHPELTERLLLSMYYTMGDSDLF